MERKDDFPWIYAIGKGVIETIESSKNQEVKCRLLKSLGTLSILLLIIRL